MLKTFLEGMPPNLIAKTACYTCWLCKAYFSDLLTNSVQLYLFYLTCTKAYPSFN